MAAVEIRIRRDTEANWLLANPVLASGEPTVAWKPDGTSYMRVGDGVRVWSELPDSQGAKGAKGDPGAPGKDGTVTPEMITLRDAAVAARDQAEVFSATAVELQDQAVADLISGNVSQTGAALSGKYARRRAYDVRDYMGSDDIGAAVNRAIRAAKSDANGYGVPGQVIIPPGNFAQTTEINFFMADGKTAHGVDLIGSGWGKTVLRPQGKMASIHHISSSGTDALRDVLFANFEIDGSEQTLGGGGYETLIKGFYIQRMRRVTFDHLYVHDTGATGVGTDYHDSCTMRDIVANGCGRLNSGSGGGGAGIGIGTGVWITEALVVEGCVTRGNKRAGIFFETQSGTYPTGTRLIGHVSEFNGTHGIEDAGVRGLTVVGGSSRRNGVSGFELGPGTIPPAGPGIDGRVMGLDVSENGADGILVDYTGRFAGDGKGTNGIPGGFKGYEQSGAESTFQVEELNYTFSDVTTRANKGAGVRIKLAATDLKMLQFSSVNSIGNDGAGLSVTSTGGRLVDASLDNFVARGNGRSAASSVRAGVHIGAGTVNLRMTNSRAMDRQPDKTQTYGLSVSSGTTHRDILLLGNDFRGNATGETSMDGAYFTGSPAYSLNPGLPDTPGADSPKYSDTFVRTDSLNSLGETDGGTQPRTPWAVLDAGTGGSFGIVSNSARVTGGTGNVCAVVDVGKVAGTHRVTMSKVAEAPTGGLAFRVQDASNLIFVPFRKSGLNTNQYSVEKRVAGSRTVIASTTLVPADGDRIRVEDDGSEIKLFVNDVLVATATDSAFNTATKAGLHANYSVDAGNTRYRDWSFT